MTDIIDFGKPMDELFPLLNGEQIQEEGGFTWHIENWNALGDKEISPPYSLGGFRWNTMLFPKGNNNQKCFAAYLEPVPESETADDAWYVCAQFAVIVSRPKDSGCHVVRTSYHRFCKNDTDWGFSDFMELDKLKNRYSSLKSSIPTGLIVDGQVDVSAYIRIIKDDTGVLWHNFVNYNSKEVTGFVGLNNQGATCYLNSLLQTYYFTTKFRKLVYAIPTENDKPTDSVPLALQRAFYLLQTSDEPLDTQELTKSFGWDNGDAFTQHDIQELNRILMDKLDSKVSLKDLFVGKMKSYIKCINVDYESSRIEDFWDIQLNVKGMKNLEQSFENYIEVEKLEGENQYQAEGFGLQDAEKGVTFNSFPPVLYLQLKRFEYDFNFDRLTKINDRYEFPESIDLSPYGNGKTYDLQGVLVHSGDIFTGHYYAILKPDDGWYRFDDDRVWKVNRKAVFDDNFGCDRLSDDEIRKMTKQRFQNYSLKRQTSAYMLVYIERASKEDVLQEVLDEDVPEVVVETLKREKEEAQKRKDEVEEMRSYYKTNIVTEDGFLNYEGFDLFPNRESKFYHPDLYEYNPLETKFLKTSTVGDVKAALGCKNLWVMGYNQTNALRLDTMLDADNATLENAFKKLGRSKFLDVCLYADNHDLGDEIVLFVKLLDKDKIFGYKTITVTPLTKLSSIYNSLLEENPSILPYCFEEISPNEIEDLEMSSTVVESELGNGDILAFGTQENMAEVYSYLRFRVRIIFSQAVANSEFVTSSKHENFCLWISAKSSCQCLAEQCAAVLDVPWQNLRLTACYENEKIPLKSHGHLEDYLLKNFSFVTIPPFEFEVLSIPLVELENLKPIQVHYLEDNYIHSVIMDFKMPSSATVFDLKEKIFNKLGEKKDDLLLWTNVDHKFQGLLSDDTPIAHIGGVDICARNICIDKEKKLVLVVQYFKSINRTHGVSFIFELVPKENATEMKKRLHRVFGLGQKEFSKIKISLFSDALKKAIDLSDMSTEQESETIPYDILEKSDLLFMDHPDRSRYLGERPMTIK